MRIAASVLVAGSASGPVLAIPPLSFWGGFDPVEGWITDRSHPMCGLRLAGAMLVMEAGRGSSSSSSVLAEAIRLGTGPSGIILARPDAILAVGAQVAATLYGSICPVVVVTAADHRVLAASTSLSIQADTETASIEVNDAALGVR